MVNWETVCRQDTINWLLEEENPSVCYFTWRDLLDKGEDDADMQAIKRQIMQRGMVPQLLDRQQEASYLQAYPRFYTYKYKGLVWSLIVLAELGAEKVPSIEAQCEYLLNHSQERQDGGFAQNTAVKAGGGRITEVIPCLTGNMVWSLIHFGYLCDPRLQNGIDWLTRFMRYNDGEETDPQIPPYNHYEMCFGAHTCHMGVVKALKAFSAIPREKRGKEIDEAIGQAAEFLLLHHIYKRSHNLNRASKPGWLKFGFPLMYQTDALEILDILTSLGYRDPRMEEALQVVLEKQDGMGRWKVENTYNSDRLLVAFEQKGEPSKWITLRALRVLKRYAQAKMDQQHF